LEDISVIHHQRVNLKFNTGIQNTEEQSLGEHFDYGCLTLITHNITGLEVCSGNNWIVAEPKKYNYVVVKK
jgi:isopenicillin N synthase-like dioxygenase